jgi:hypothetical protein
MKLNEAKFRSPKWLRNYVDFEVNTGDDISGEPSKRKADKLEKERQAKLKKEAEEREAKLKSERLKKQAEAEREKARQNMYEEWKKSAKRQA